jgi:hypothetical protein
MKVLSWDVGLRTLSFCLLSGEWCAETQTVKYTVHEWDSVDVQVDGVATPAPPPPPPGRKRKAATDIIAPDAATSVTTLTGTKKTGQRKKMDAVSVEEGARMVCDAIHRRATSHGFTDADTVIIEQQPAGGHNRHSNVRMKVMSHVIHMYFYVRGLLSGSNASVAFVSPASKLVGMKKEESDKEKTVGQLYGRNKKYAVHKTTELLGGMREQPGNQPWHTLFESSTVSKKDDLADAFLLGYYYLSKHVAPKVVKTRAKRKVESTAV